MLQIVTQDRPLGLGPIAIALIGLEATVADRIGLMLDLQLSALTAAEVRSNDVWSDKASGLRSDGPGLVGALKACRLGDVPVV